MLLTEAIKNIDENTSGLIVKEITLYKLCKRFNRFSLFKKKTNIVNLSNNEYEGVSKAIYTTLYFIGIPIYRSISITDNKEY